MNVCIAFGTRVIGQASDWLSVANGDIPVVRVCSVFVGVSKRCV